MAETLGTIRGQMVLDIKQALAAYTAARQAHVSTVTALHTGAGALTQVGAVVGGMGIAMGAGIMVAVDAAAEFERKLDYFGAVSASTQAEYDAVREKALQLGQDTIYSANQIADSFIELGKAGVSAKDIIGGVGEGVAALGAAADIPLDTAATIIMSAVQTFGLGADQAVGVADKLAGAANASIVDVSDLGTSLKYAGGVAASLGIPFEDVNTALGLLGQYGLRGSTAGTSLRQMLVSLGGATKPATKMLKQLGIITEDGSNKFFDANGSAKSLAEIYQILQDATAGMSDEQRLAALKTIFQNRALASAIALTTEGAAGFDKMAEAIDKTTAAEVAGKRLDNLSGDIEILQGNLDTLFIQSGSGFQNFAREIVQAVTQVVQAFADLPAGTQQTIVTILAVIAVILTIVGFLGLFAGAILNLIALAIQLGPVFAAVGRAFTIVTGAVKAFGLALMANPVGLIITAIALLVAALIWFFTQTEIGRTAWAEFTRFLGEAWTNIVNFAQSTFENLGNFFSDLWTNIGNFFKTAIDTILNIFFNFTPLGILISNWGTIVAFFQTLWNNIVTGIVGFVTGVITWFQMLPARVGAFFAALPYLIGYLLGQLLAMIVLQIMAIWNFFTVTIPAIVTSVVTWFQQLPGQIIALILSLYIGAVLWFNQLWTDATRIAGQIVEGVVGWIQALPHRVIAFFVTMYQGIVQWLMEARANAMVQAAAILNGIIQFVQQVPTRVGEFFSTMYANIVNWLGQAVVNAGQMGLDIYNGITGAITGLPGAVTDIFNNVVGAIRGMITRAFNAVRDFAAGVWEGFKDGLGIHSPSYIEHAMWAITDVTETETQRLAKQVRTIQGLGNGISEVGNNLGNNFGSGMDGGVHALEAAMKSAKSMQADVTFGATATGSDPTQAAALRIADSIESLKDEPREVHYDIVNNNPAPEPASESLPKAIRQATYVFG